VANGVVVHNCIAELEVPLTFKLQFLEEAAAEKRKIKNKRKGGAGNSQPTAGSKPAQQPQGSSGRRGSLQQPHAQ